MGLILRTRVEKDQWSWNFAYCIHEDYICRFLGKSADLQYKSALVSRADALIINIL